MTVGPNELSFEQNDLSAADFTASRDDDTSLSSGTVGEIATVEVNGSSAGTLSQYRGVFVGQPPRQASGDAKGNEIYVKLRSGSSDIADNAQFALAARNKGELGGGRQGNLTGFIKHRGQDSSDPRQRKAMPVQQPMVPEGRLISLLAKDENNSLTVDLSEVTSSGALEIPIMGGK